VKEVASCVVHESVAEPPCAIVEGLATSVHFGAVGGGGRTVTVMVAGQFTLTPDALVAVPV
jgi:hypothetical protein